MLTDDPNSDKELDEVAYTESTLGMLNVLRGDLSNVGNFEILGIWI